MPSQPFYAIKSARHAQDLLHILSKNKNRVENKSRAENKSKEGEQKPRLLIIGSGMIGREHMRVATLLGRADVHGIYDIEASSLDNAAADFATYSTAKLQRYTNLESACLDPDVDVIMICTPNFTHFDILRVAMQSGKPLFLEKPMATSLADAASIVRLAEDYSSFIQIGMQYRYKAQYADAFHEVLQCGALGSVKTVAMSEYRPPFLDKVGQWNKFNRYSGGTLVEKCCHYFDLINAMAGAEPESIYASGGRAVNFLEFEYAGKTSDIDDHAFVIINYCNEVRASFTLNMFTQELNEELIVCGERGRLKASEFSSFKPGTPSQARLMVEVSERQDYQENDVTYPALIAGSGHHGATLFEHMALIDQVQGKPADAATPLQGFKAIAVASAAQESMATESVVDYADFLTHQGLDDI